MQVKKISILFFSFLALFIFASKISPLSFADMTTTSNCVDISIDNPPANTPSGCGTQCSTTTPTDLAAIQKTLSADNINLSGDELTLANATEVFNTWCLLKKSPKYVQLLGATASNPIEIRFKHTSESQGAHAYPCSGYSSAVASRYVEIYGAASVGTSCLPYRLDFLIAHELGHQIAFANHDIYNQFLTSHDDPAFPTWNCILDYGRGHWSAECFPDMIAEYVFYKKWFLFTDPPQPFPQMKTQFLDMYTFTKNTIFGGVEY